MKKNGFTLLELIVTLGIMALMGVVIGTNMLGLFSNEEEKQYEKFVKRIENAACMYVETNKTDDKSNAEFRSDCQKYGCVINIYDLIEKGYIDENLKDPETNENVSDDPDKYSVNVNYINYEKVCKMKGRATDER